MICLGGAIQVDDRHDALRTRGEVPIRMLPNADRGTMNTRDMTKTSQI